MSDLLADFFGDGNEISPVDVDPALEALLENWMATIRGGGVGFLPRGANHRTYWYAFAPSPPRRRELLGLLDAWVGPAYSDLATRRGELEATDPFDLHLAQMDVPPLRFEVLPRTSPGSVNAKIEVRNALATLTRLLLDRPPSQFNALRTTLEILDDLGHAIAVQDRDLAASCTDELEQAADLDESNLAFLRIRMFAGLRDWAAIFAEPALEHVLSMRRPLGVTRAIQTGLYYQRYAEFDHPGAEGRLHDAARLIEPRLRDLFTGAPPATRPEALVELLARLHSVGEGPDDAAIDELVNRAAQIEPGLDAHFRRVAEELLGARDEEAPAEPGPAVAQTARINALAFSGQHAACIELGLASEVSVEAGRALVYAAPQLSSSEWSARVIDYLNVHGLRDQVASTAPSMAADVEALERSYESGLRGWDTWLARLADTDSERVELTSSAVQSWEPLSSSEVMAFLAHATDAALARLGELGGQFLAAHAALLEGPDGADLALRLVAALALGEKASAGVRAQALALAELIIGADPGPSVYDELLEWTSLLIEANASASTVGWMCDVVATLTSIPAPASADVVLSLYYRSVEALRPYRSALGVTELETLDLVASELNAEVPADFQVVESDEPEQDPAAPYRYLANKTVVLHSLTESATTRAAQVLRRLVPTIDVRTNSEPDGSPQLGQQSSNADLFVVVTASAKHAATTFIDAHRGGLPTIFVNSRGSSAILRALAAFSG